jgi:hypothetical protein
MAQLQSMTSSIDRGRPAAGRSLAPFWTCRVRRAFAPAVGICCVTLLWLLVCGSFAEAAPRASISASAWVVDARGAHAAAACAVSLLGPVTGTKGQNQGRGARTQGWTQALDDRGYLASAEDLAGGLLQVRLLPTPPKGAAAMPGGETDGADLLEIKADGPPKDRKAPHPVSRPAAGQACVQIEYIGN